jgi:hypothetical protein
MTTRPIPPVAGPQPVPGVPPVPELRQLDAATPVLFLPVNIETRFMDGVEGSPELWLRVYPDQIAINSHEPELTDQEIADGKTYWDTLWRAGNPPPSVDTVKAPWRGLASRYGTPRAAWIVLAMTPLNVQDQPAAPTPDRSDPNPLPVYPTPSIRPSSWNKAAIADALPDAWTVVAVTGSQSFQFRGSPITPSLAVGMTPGTGAFPPGAPVDEGMQWLVDFDTALKAGMALKISLTPEQRARGFDRIIVYGLRAEGDKGSDVFASLVSAHHYTDGFALVPQGAPTNNTPDADSAYSRKDVDYETSFAVERGDPLTKDPAGDGNDFAKWIGIDPALLAHAGSADKTCERNGRDMLTALWPATFGYFLTQMMADVFTPQQIETARQYVIANAIPRGPIPPFRVGSTPYGVLPATSLRRYPKEPGRLAGSFEPPLVDFLLRLWPSWLASSTGAPHMQNSGDPDAQLVQVLGMDASSMTFRGRQVFGDEFLWNYITFQGVQVPVINPWWSEHLARGRAVLNSFGYDNWDPRVIHLGLAQNSFPVPFPTVQAGPLSETEQLKPDADLGSGKKGNYIQWLRQASVSDMQAENYPGPKPTALFYKILRQSLLLDYAKLATFAEINASRLTLSQIREQEIIGVKPQATMPQPQEASQVSVWEVLAKPSIPNPQLSWAEYLVNLDPPPQSPFSQLAELRACLDRLALLSTAELDRLLTETLDACSHRLDVWVTAVATAILGRKRAAQISGVHLGGFGWVEEVRPASHRPTIQGAELEAVRQLDARRSTALKRQLNLAVPVQPLEDNGGFILAPSLAQASVGAVLRNGYMTHKGTAQEGLLSIDLSSERVRNALVLLEGVQQGQSLNALLGYLFEAGLHAVNLDKYAQPFRDRFPVVANKLTASSDPSESVAASNVVDGLALRTAWDNGQLPSGGNWGVGLPGPGIDQTTVIGLLKTIDDYADALADLSISEAVFQIIRGNFGQAGTLMDAISKGARPPNPEVVNTPRGGLDLTHRVSLLFAGAPAVKAAWKGITTHPRAAAEPWLDAWLSQLLPDPATVVCDVTYQDAGGNVSQQITLADLDVGSLDVLAMVDVGQTPQKGELENRILLAAALPADAQKPQINFDPPDAPEGFVSFPDALFLAKSLRGLIGSARPLSPQDLTVPEVKAADAGGVVDTADLRTRAKDILQSLQGDLTNLNNKAAGLPGAPDPVRAALLACSFYGVPGSIPVSSTGPDPRLSDQAAAVAKILQNRVDTATKVDVNTGGTADLVSVITSVLGEDFSVLPRFTPPDFASLQSAFGQSGSLVASDPQAPQKWLLQLTHTHAAISRLDAALTLAQLLGAQDAASPDLLLGQLPEVANDKWLGLNIDPLHPPDKGRVAFACITQGDPVNQNTYAGLLIDEWPERIPSIQENAAVAFHYEEPKARAPQALLLAVCPDSRPGWDDDLVIGILEEALELTKIRTVDLDSVQEVGQILPALYFALNLQGATVSTNFATTKEFARATQLIR